MKHSGIGIKILRNLLKQGLKIFNLGQAQEVASELKVNPEYVSQVLHHLMKGGWITRLKRGLYAFTADSGFTDPPHEFEVAIAMVSPCAVSHWTAMHYHHLTQQIPNVIYAITKTSVSIPRSIDKSRYHYIKIKEDYFFGIEKVWIDQAQVLITDPERTLLDGISRPEYCGDFQEVLHAFKMRGKKLDIDKIIQYALRMDHSTIKRLGWILEKLGKKDFQLRALMKVPVKGYRKLNPAGPSKGIYNKKWMIRENL